MNPWISLNELATLVNAAAPETDAMIPQHIEDVRDYLYQRQNQSHKMLALISDACKYHDEGQVLPTQWLHEAVDLLDEEGYQ